MARVNYLKVLKWPIVTYVFAFVVFAAGALVAPEIGNMYPSDGSFILSLVFGAWVGSKMVQMGGKYYDGFIGGVVLGMVLGAIEVVSFVVPMSGMGGNPLSGFVFVFVICIGGALIGAGYASTK